MIELKPRMMRRSLALVAGTRSSVVTCAYVEFSRSEVVE